MRTKVEEAILSWVGAVERLRKAEEDLEQCAAAIARHRFEEGAGNETYFHFLISERLYAEEEMAEMKQALRSLVRTDG